MDLQDLAEEAAADADDVDLKADLRKDVELLVNNLLQHFDAITNTRTQREIDDDDDKLR